MDVLHVDAVLEERGHGLGRVAPVSAAKLRHEEGQLGMLPRVVDQAAEGRTDLFVQRLLQLCSENNS